MGGQVIIFGPLRNTKHHQNRNTGKWSKDRLRLCMESGEVTFFPLYIICIQRSVALCAVTG
jgi:hypothetical protein